MELSHTFLGRFVALPPLVFVPFATQNSMIFSAASPLSLLSSTSLATWAFGKPQLGNKRRRGLWARVGSKGGSGGWLVVIDGSGDGILIVADGFGEVILSAGGGGAAVGFEEEADGESGSRGGTDEDDMGGRGGAMEEGGGVGGEGGGSAREGGEAPQRRDRSREDRFVGSWSSPLA